MTYVWTVLKAEDDFNFIIPDKKEGEGEAKEGDEAKADGDKKKEKADKKKEAKKEPKKEPKKPKIETIKEPLEFEITLLDMANMTAELKKASKDKLEALATHDREKKARSVSELYFEALTAESQPRGQFYEAIIQRKTPPGGVSLNLIWNCTRCLLGWE